MEQFNSRENYHRFRWYATLENKTPKISVNLTCYRHVGSKCANRSPLSWHREGQKVTLVAVIGGFRSDLSTTHVRLTEILETFLPVFCFPKSRINENGGNWMFGHILPTWKRNSLIAEKIDCNVHRGTEQINSRDNRLYLWVYFVHKDTEKINSGKK